MCALAVVVERTFVRVCVCVCVCDAGKREEGRKKETKKRRERERIKPMTYIQGGQIATQRDWRTAGFWAALFWSGVNYVHVFFQTLFATPSQIDLKRAAAGRPSMFRAGNGLGTGNNFGGQSRPGASGQPRLSGMDTIRRPARLSSMPCSAPGG